MSTLKKILLAATAAAMLATTLVESLPAQSAQAKHKMEAAPTQADDPASAGYQAALNKMRGELVAMHYTGNADVDFVHVAVPNNRAAIDMAMVLLDYGKDPQLRKMAQNIITTQTKEIDEMENWLATHPAN